MSKTIERLAGDLFLFLLACLLMVGCASAPQAPLETATPAPPTPDPLYTLHCIRQSGKSELCYVSDVLAADTARLEKVTRQFCLSSETFGCTIHIWKDEGSVPQGTLTDAEKSTRIAFFSSRPNTGTECFQTFDNNGGVMYSSSDCD